jgi:hypothetical protein
MPKCKKCFFKCKAITIFLEKLLQILVKLLFLISPCINMKDSKLIETLSIMTFDQLTEFQQMLHSDLVLRGSTKRECLKLLDYLMRYFPNFKNIDLNKKELMNDLFDDTSAKINKLEKVMSSLLSALEYYIVYFIGFKTLEEVKSNLTLVKFYHLSGIPQRGEIYLRRLKEYFDKNVGLSVEYYYWYGQYLEQTSEATLLSKSVNPNEVLDSLIAHHKVYAMIVSLDTLCKTVYGRAGFDEATTRLFQAFEQDIAQNEIYQNNILIKIYELALKMLQNVDSEDNIYYEKYKNIVEEYQAFVNTESAKVIFTMQRSFTIFCYNRVANERNTAEYMRVYREHLDRGYLVVDGMLKPNIVVNLILLAIKEKNAEWIYQFIQQWKNQIGTLTDRQEILNFCWANYYFISKDFDKAEDYISLNYENLGYLLYIRRMRLKILFEKQEFLHLSYEVDAFKVYVFRQYKKENLTEELYRSNNYFADFLKQLDSLTHYPSERKKEKVATKIALNGSADKEWLLEKIAEVKVRSL